MYTGMVWTWASAFEYPRDLRIVGWNETMEETALSALK
jgi:hypothetical protein